MSCRFVREHLSIPKHLDKRRKLTDVDKDKIREMHKGGISIRGIARMFAEKCSRRSIQFILFPERYKTMMGHKKKRNWDYHPEAHRVACKKWYMRKTDLMLKGELV